MEETFNYRNKIPTTGIVRWAEQNILSE